MIATREKNIAGHTYKVTQLGAKAGRTMLVRLLKLIGPGVAQGLTSITGGITDTTVVRALGEALQELLSRVDEAEVAQILDELARHTVVVVDAQREPRLSDVFDDHFAGNYGALTQWAAFALEVNFASFFGGEAALGGLLDRLGALSKASLSGSPSPSTSTGTSGASSRASASGAA